MNSLSTEGKHFIRHKIFYGFRIVFITMLSLFIFEMHYLVFQNITEIFSLQTVDISYFNISLYSILFYFFCIMSLSFTVASILIDIYVSKISNFIYKVSVIWSGFIFYFLLIALLSPVISFVFKILDIQDFLFFFTIKLFYILAIFLNIHGLYNSKNVKIVEKVIQIKNLPKSWEKKKAIFISDTHYGVIHNKQAAKKVVNIINEINRKDKIDFLFHTGDFYDGPKIDWSIPANEYKFLDENIKKYFVSGNHEEYAQSDDYEHNILNYIQEAGFVIANGKVFNESGVNIIGIDYAHGSQNDIEKIKKVFESFDYKNSFIKRIKNEVVTYDKSPSIILKHVPKNIKILSDYEADFVLCGHTHNGQMFPLNYLTEYVYDGFHYGFKYEKDTLVYTTSGVGSWGPPQRIGTKAEIAILTFTEKEI